MPADVVRYHGLDKMMALRDEAKAGLARMEAMGQMGNSEEATIPDGIPFNMDDLDIEDENSLQMQTGGLVPDVPVGINPPRDPFMPPVNPPSSGYQPPQQTQVPIASAPSVLPAFNQYITPPQTQTVEYINPTTGEKRVFTFINGSPTVPIPEGFIPVSQYQQPESTKPELTTKPQIDPNKDNDPPGPDAPRIDQFGREEDSRITQVKQNKEFVEIAKNIDPRGFIEKIKDDFMGAIGASTTSQEYQKALDELAVGIANYTSDPDEQNKIMAEIKGNLNQPTRTKLDTDLAPVTTGTTADLLAKIKKSRNASPETTRVKTAQVTAGADTTVSEAAQVDYASLSDFQKDIVDSITPTSYNEEEAKSLGISYNAKNEGRILTPVEKEMLKNSIATELMTVGKDTAAPTTDTKPSDAIPTARDTSFAPIDTEGVVEEETRIDQTRVAKRNQRNQRNKRIEKETEEQTQNYRNRGYSESDAKKAGRNKALADDEAREQTGESQAKAVTDKDGKAVRSGSDGSVVTSNRKRMKRGGLASKK